MTEYFHAIVTGGRAVTGGQPAAPPRRDRDRDRDGDRDGCGPAGVRRPEPPRAAHRHTHTHTHTHTRTGPARDPPQIPAPAAAPPGPAGSAAPAAGERPRHGTARLGTATVCPDPQPDSCPGCEPPPTPSPRLQRRFCPAPAARLREQRRMLSDLDLESIPDRTGILPLATGVLHVDILLPIGIAALTPRSCE
ncbi:proline-rich proteoglycan 2-like [Oenanthe melanoleuca]|uniref:proline-rich proteoglycan 2-like n=1 Tax=Oenanthe melanoleuca TaxID=2939378 RepID=UPI0024C11D25|nr:proline-rich proteoglycan 2-like [Oenanthe melanoleuca]